jgi:hypothetical protein
MCLTLLGDLLLAAGVYGPELGIRRDLVEVGARIDAIFNELEVFHLLLVQRCSV